MCIRVCVLQEVGGGVEETAQSLYLWVPSPLLPQAAHSRSSIHVSDSHPSVAICVCQDKVQGDCFRWGTRSGKDIEACEVPRTDGSMWSVRAEVGARSGADNHVSRVHNSVVVRPPVTPQPNGV